MDNKLYKAYVSILEEELLPAMGCTKPIAVAYASALARKTLGALPDRVKVCVSANIIKNVKSVIVPHTGGQRGIEAAVAAGIVAGDADAELEVLSKNEYKKRYEMIFGSPEEQESSFDEEDWAGLIPGIEIEP